MSSQGDDAAPREGHPASEGGDGGGDGEDAAKRSRKRTKLGVYTSGETLLVLPAPCGGKGVGIAGWGKREQPGSCQRHGGTATPGNQAIH
jgi:hypothetical protein